MDAYIRVSRVGGRSGETFISPEVQREQIAGWAQSRSVTIDAWHEDLDQSGGKAADDRPGLSALLARIESGQSDGVVVAKLDRLSRLGAGDALKLVERIIGAGGKLVAVDVGLDPTTTVGEFGITIMLALARMERRRIGDNWLAARTKAVGRGAYAARTPFGYKRVNGGHLEPDPATAPHVTKAFEVAGREGPGAAARYLAEHCPQRVWTSDTVRRMVNRNAYLGKTEHGDLKNGMSHKPLVSRSVWEAAQDQPRTVTKTSGYPLSRLVHCATCSHPMVSAPKARDGRRMYGCSAAQTLYKGERCTKPAYVLADTLEPYVYGELEPLIEAVRGVEPGSDTQALEAALLEAENELTEFGDDLTARRLLRDGYHAALETRANAVEQARTALAEATRDRTRSVELTEGDVLGDPILLGEWLRRVGLRISVIPGRGKVDDRVVFEDLGGGIAVSE